MKEIAVFVTSLVSFFFSAWRVFTIASCSLALPLLYSTLLGFSHFSITFENQHNARGVSLYIPAAKPIVNTSLLDHGVSLCLAISLVVGFKNGGFDSCEGVAVMTHPLMSLPPSSRPAYVK